MQLEPKHYLILGLAGLAVIALAIVLSNKVKAKINRSGLEIDTDKGEKKDRVNVNKIDNSEVGIHNREGQDITAKNIRGSNVNIK